MSEPSEPPAAPAPAAESAGPAPEAKAPPESARWPRTALAAVGALALAALLWPRGESALSRRPAGFLLDEGGRPVPIGRELRAATLVHFWASWCAPCLTELPELLAFAQEATGDRFQVVLVAVGDEPQAARRFLGETEQPLYFDPNWEVANRFGTEKLPESHLVVSGEVVASFVGATRWSDPAVRATIQKWTASPASAAP
jgi:thiol-disulfide isomerase/thioredoxin